MPADYAIIIKSRAGVPVRVLTGVEGGFRWLSYRKEVNGVGLLMFDLDGEHTAIDDLEQNGQVEVWRWDDDADVTAHVDFESLYLEEERFADDDGNVVFRATCPGILNLIKDVVIAWPANTDNRSMFDAEKAETVLKTLVTYNCVAASATVANGRIRTTDITTISVAADGAAGNTITFACAHQPLVEALQDVARIGDRDFYLTRTAAQTWQFRTKQYLGDDRSTTVTFALNFGNMGNPSLRRNRLNESTVAIVGGQGTDDDRVFVVRLGANYDATFNSKEVFVPATQYTTTDGLNAAGDIRLDELRAKDDLQWEIIQTPGSRYNVHYFHGDIVTGYFLGVTAAKQIVVTEVTFAPSNERAESIRLETANV